MRYRFDIKTKDLIVWRGWVVMSRSETPFLEMLFQRVAELKPSTVLEVGFGLGISAQLIQQFLRPAVHDVVEIDEGIYEDLKAFAAARRGVNAIRGSFWTFKPRHKYDFIFYDAFEYLTDGESTDEEQAQYNQDEAHRMRELLQPGGVVCCPHFGGGKPERMPGFRRRLYERLDVPPYLLHDGTYTTKAAIVCWELPASSLHL